MGGCPMMDGMSGMMGSGWMAVMMAISALIGLGLAALLIVGVVVGIRWLMSGGAGREATRDRALAVARERYARGEVSREEFERLRQDLS
jgi:putative membrane protein